MVHSLDDRNDYQNIYCERTMISTRAMHLVSFYEVIARIETESSDKPN
jgi:hypothetical protein